MHSDTPLFKLCPLRSGWPFRTLMVLGLVSLHSLVLVADIIRVPQDQNTIQAAIDFAKANDTVLVAAGTYRERILLKPGVIVKSAGADVRGKVGLDRAEKTIIVGAYEGAKGPGVTMADDSVLDGFTVTGVGDYDDDLWNKHHATQGNEQPHEMIGEPGTAGISVIGIGDCTVKNNIVHHVGYTGIAIMGAANRKVSPLIYANVTYRNMGGGIGSMKKSTARIEGNLCFENYRHRRSRRRCKLFRPQRIQRRT